MAVAVNNKSVTIGQAIILKDFLQAQITTNTTAISTLYGSDATTKSVRTIAAEELARQLIPENANEARDTLEEIAAWIQQHPEDAATMNSAISANTSAIAAINNADTGILKSAKDYTDGLNTSMNTRVTALETSAAGIEVATDSEFRTALGIPESSGDSE